MRCTSSRRSSCAGQFRVGGACSCTMGLAACAVRRFSACSSSSTRVHLSSPLVHQECQCYLPE
jgi:hypothetical protein